ncbi:MAG: hypothetical protein D6731_03100 [Planctomycetota bacterium]|nr:MAG: hypothetical protein D6731_03100 [Planctomycetota bacterium]
MSLRRALALGVLCWLAGCSSIPLGPVRRPELYPDRTSPEAAFATFLWAWNAGDVPVLRAVLGAWLRHDLEERIARKGVEETAAFYRGAGDLRLLDIEWRDVGEALAYVRAVLAGSAVPRAELDFSLLRRPDGWVVTGKRLLR